MGIQGIDVATAVCGDMTNVPPYLVELPNREEEVYNESRHKSVNWHLKVSTGWRPKLSSQSCSFSAFFLLSLAFLKPIGVISSL